jgi:hypothetical protein
MGATPPYHGNYYIVGPMSIFPPNLMELNPDVIAMILSAPPDCVKSQANGRALLSYPACIRSRCDSSASWWITSERLEGARRAGQRAADLIRRR